MKLKRSAKKNIGVLLGITFFSVGFFGLQNTMPTDSNGVMQDCLFQGSAEEPCDMTLTEHVSSWQKLFIFVTPSNSVLLSILLLVFALAVFSFQFSLFDQLHFRAVGIRAWPPEYFSGFLLRAFGRGILRKRE